MVALISSANRRMNKKINTRISIANVDHDLRCTFDIDFHAVTLESLHYNTHSTKRGNKFKSADHSQLQKMGMLGEPLYLTCLKG